MADGFSIAWDGLKEVYAKLDEMVAKADQAAKEIVARSAAVIEKEAKANFEGVHKKGQPHVGGNKPNVVTGTLSRSIRADPIVRTGRAEYGTTVAPRVIYARRVELGYNGSRGYPYFRPAAEKVRPQLQAIAAEVWRKYMLG